MYPGNRSRLENNQAFLQLLATTNPAQRNQLIRTASQDQLNSVCECAHNILRSNVPLSSDQIRKLRKHRSVVYRIADKRVPLGQKRKILEQNGGAIAAILIPVISAIASAVAGALNK